MPKPSPPEKGVRGYRRFRYGNQPGMMGPCTGVNKAHDKSTLFPTDLVDGINVRVQDGILVTRGGQSLTEDNMNGCIQGLIDIEGVGSRAILAHNERSPNAGIDILDESSTPNYVKLEDKFNEHPNPAHSGGSSYDDTKPRYVYTWWDGNIVFQAATTNPLYKLILPDEKMDLDKIQVEELFPLQVPGEGSAFKVGSLTTLPGFGTTRQRSPLYFGTMGGGVVGYIQGKLVRLLAEATFSGRVVVFSYNNRLYAAGAQKVMFQASGWSTGGDAASTSWTNMTMPVEVTDFRPMCGAEGLGFGWIGGYDDSISFPTDKGFILKLDDSSGTPVLSSALNSYGGGPDRLMSVDDFAIRGSIVYAGWRWETTGGSFFASAGEWNGTVLTERVGFGESNAMVHRIATTQSLLYVSGYGGSSGVGLWTWDGSSSVQITDLATLFGDSESPFDMVLF
jgi:hypothetical protein